MVHNVDSVRQGLSCQCMQNESNRDVVINVTLLISRYSLIRNSHEPSMKDLEITFQGNLCRCTGYRPIIEGSTEL